MKDSSASDVLKCNREHRGTNAGYRRFYKQKRDRGSHAKPAEKPKQENSRWEKEPENVEMKLWDVGKDQAETGSLKDLLDGSDEDLEEWKD